MKKEMNPVNQGGKYRVSALVLTLGILSGTTSTPAQGNFPSSYIPEDTFLKSEPRWWHTLEHPPSDTFFWREVRRDRLFINLHPGVPVDSIQPFLDQHHLKIIRRSMFPEILNFITVLNPDSTPEGVLRIVRDAYEHWQRFIRGVEPEPVIRMYSARTGNASHAFCPPGDPAWLYYRRHWGPYQIYADSAWCITTGGSGKYIAVIDDAVDWWHEDLLDYVWKGYDYADGDFFVTPASNNCAHGTHVTGIVAATHNNNRGLAGIVQDTIYFAKVQPDQWCLANLRSLDATAIVNAIQDIGIHPKIITVNMSFGSYAYSATQEAACNFAWNNGKLLIASSGNDTTTPVIYPARYSSVIAVGSVDEDLSLSIFSNWGVDQELVAPGGEYVSGWSVYYIYSTIPGNNYAYLPGTSMAAPHVTGVASLLWAVNPCMNNIIARQILQQTAMDLGSPGRDVLYGYGLVQAHHAVLEALPMDLILIDAVSPSCASTCDGRVAIGFNGPYDGIPPYTVSWNDGGSGFVRENLCAGTYTVTVTDATGCQATLSVTLNAPAPLQVQVSILQSASSPNSCDASAQVQISGGTPSYSVTWSSGEIGFTASQLCPGNQWVRVEDANGCIRQIFFDVPVESTPPVGLQPSSSSSVFLQWIPGSSSEIYLQNTGTYSVEIIVYNITGQQLRRFVLPPRSRIPLKLSPAGAPLFLHVRDLTTSRTYILSVPVRGFSFSR